jgi:hypothetical protein
MKFGTIGEKKKLVTANFVNIPKTSMCMCRRCGAMLNRDKRKNHDCPKTPPNKK